MSTSPTRPRSTTLWKPIAADHPRIDILVNNAGINTNTPRTHEYSVADWDRVMAVNLRGVFLTTRKALALMLPGPGSIINLSSIMGLRGYWPGFAGDVDQLFDLQGRHRSASPGRSRPNTPRRKSASTPSRRAGTAAPRSAPNGAPRPVPKAPSSSRKRSTRASR